MTGNGSGSPWPNIGGLQRSSGISFTKEELKKGAEKIDPGVTRVEGMEEGTQKLPVPPPYFGVIGWGVQTVHQEAITEHKEALARARRALQSWIPAIKQADRNYSEADDNSGPPNFGGPGGGDLGNIGDLGQLGKPELPVGQGGLPDMPDTGRPGIPDGTMPDIEQPGVGDLPGTGPDGSGPPGMDGPGTDLPGVDLPDPGVDLPEQSVPSTDPADMKVPDIDSALNSPARTDLSSYQPTTPQMPAHLSTTDPSQLGTRTGAGPFGGGSGVGMGANAGQNAGMPGGLRGAGGQPGMPMMPFAPMGGAGAGKDQERDREKTLGLAEDEGVWGGDVDIAPEVIGKEDL